MGTPELQRKKLDATRGEDPALSTHAIDRAYAQGALNEEQRRAAWRYTCLRYATFGKLSVQCAGYTDLVHEHLGADMVTALDEERAEELAREFKDADLALHDAGYVAREVVRHLCLDDADIRGFGLRFGLKALVDHWGFTQ